MAEPLTYEEDYWDNADLKREFIRFLSRIHRLDLTRWDRAGFWDGDYRPFSYFRGDRLVSNVCVYSMDMVVADRRRRVAQISAVGTDPAFRRQGLGRELSRKALDWAGSRHDFFFLFADEEAFGLYERLGFRRVAEHKARVAVAGRVAVPGAVRLDLEERSHLDLIHHLALARSPVSDQLGVMNDRLLMFWCLYGQNWKVSHIEETDSLVLFSRENGLVTIFDVVGAAVPDFPSFYPYIADPGDKAVEFLFMHDKMNLVDPEWIAVETNGTHLMGEFPLEGTEFIFPYTAHA